MLPVFFVLKPGSSPLSGMEGLRRNIAAIGSTPLPPTVGSSLGRGSVLAQGMREGLLSNFASQASGKWVVSLSRYLIVANTRGLRFFGGGTPLPWHDQGYLEVTIKRKGGGLIGINS